VRDYYDHPMPAANSPVAPPLAFQATFPPAFAQYCEDYRFSCAVAYSVETKNPISVPVAPDGAPSN